jgi:hypothetical protein
LPGAIHFANENLIALWSNLMKKTYRILLSNTLVLILAACSGNPSESNTTVQNSDSADREFEIPIEMQLMLGTVKLDETEQAIDSQQAAELLPLWRALSSLASSDTAAQAEVDAVISSIQDGMTAEQIEAIEAMGLTMQDFGDIVDTLGIETGFGARFGEMTPEMQATIEAARESGEGRPGGFGGGQGFGGSQGPGGGFGGDTGITPEMRETAIAARGGSFGRGFGINVALLDGIIVFLEAK